MIVQQDTDIAARQLSKLFGEGLKAEIDVDIPLVILKESAYAHRIIREMGDPDAKIKVWWVQRPKTPLLS